MGTEGLGPQRRQEPLDFNVSKQAAEASYSKELVEGEVVGIERGDVKSRAMAIGGVYAESIEKKGMGWVGDAVTAFINWKEQRPVFVKIQTPEGKNLYLNVNSLNKRLGIPKEKILAAANTTTGNKKTEAEAKSKAILHLIHEYTVLNKEREQRITEKFSEIQEKYATQHRTVDESLLLKALRTTLISGFEQNQQDQAVYKLSEGTLLHLSKQAEGEFPLMTHLTEEKPLGEGSFARAQAVTVLSTGEEVAIKIVHDAEKIQQKQKAAILKMQNEGITDTPEPYTLNQAEGVVSEVQEETKREYDTIEKIHAIGKKKGVKKVRGIQDPLIQKIDVSFKGKDYVGHMGAKYEGDLSMDLSAKEPSNSDYIPITMKYVKNCGFDLLNGLSAMAQANIAHGDIKPENCLVRTKEDGTREVVIADFGGAVDLDKSLELPSTGTEDYCNDSDRMEYNALKIIHKQKIKEFDALYKKIIDPKTFTDELVSQASKVGDEARNYRNQILDLQKKRDVYAMGIVLKQVLDRFHTQNEGPEKVASAFLKIQSLYALINKMCDPEYENRPTAEEALNEYREIFPPSLDDQWTFTAQDMKNCGLDLLNGLSTMAANNIAHGDIKPENCLVKTKDDGTKEVIIANSETVDLNTNMELPLNRTPGFFTEEDDKQHNLLMEPYREKLKQYEPFYQKVTDPKANLTPELVEEAVRHNDDLQNYRDQISNQVKNLQKKRDVYSTGISLKKMLDRYTAKGEGTEKISFLQIRDLDRLIKKMCDLNYKKRPTAEDALEEYKRIFKIP